MPFPVGLYSGQAFAPVTHTYDGVSGTETIPTGATQLVLSCWAGGGAGARDATFCPDPRGGGSGSYSTCTIALTSADWGKTIGYSAGPTAAGRGTNGKGADGNQTTVTAGTYSLSPITCPAGGGGDVGINGAGGTLPTNANAGATNTVGNASVSASGAAAPGPGGGSGSSAVPGSGGNGVAAGTSGAGAAGRVRFAYT